MESTGAPVVGILLGILCMIFLYVLISLIEGED